MNTLKIAAGEKPVSTLSSEELKELLVRSEEISAELRHALLTQRLLAHKYGIK